jgi:hypothetical protein
VIDDIENIESMRFAFRRAGIRTFYCNVWGEAQSPSSVRKPVVGDAHWHWRDAEQARLRPQPAGMKVLYRLRIHLKEGVRL